MENNQSNKAKNGITYNHVGIPVLRSSYPKKWKVKPTDKDFNSWAEHIDKQVKNHVKTNKRHGHGT